MSIPEVAGVLGRVPVWALNVLAVSLNVSAIARGLDFIASPDHSTINLSALNEWTSPDTLGLILIILGVVSLLGVALQSAVVQSVGNIALSAVFLVMGVISFGPLFASVGWGWRAPVSYVLGGGVVHWFIANEWFNRWVEARGRHQLDR